ncbi:MAG: flagellar basal-body MS-ring/collar protein FliF [Bacillota bacterium]|nr:flagellar basal-body MS-ring/collar protein FliF [Bacillota bacterium]MDW7683016.1 flagellar basal-body MS-ring/collar protein FliF [Bacillota bacterium]
MAEEVRAGWSPQELPNRWRQLSNPRKISAIILVVAILFTLFFLGSAISRPRMAPLFSGLEPADAGRIVAKLHEMGVNYSLEDEGRTILVHEDRVYDIRIQLASDGTLIGGSAGFELFDQTKLGTTDFNRRLDYQRALQEELRRTIVQLEEVEQARVHLALPEPSLFIQDTAEPSASIVLGLSPFSSLKPEQIRGIIYLVAGSVENMSGERISIIDTQGNILSDTVEDMDPAAQLAEATLQQLEVKRAFEKELELRMQRMLERVVGPGQAIAMMTAELDFDAHESTVITFANEGVPRSETSTRETFEGTGGFIPGEAGTDSNIPGYVFVPEGGESNYERNDETTNYEIDETTVRQVRAPGQLVRLHAAVVVNDKGGELTQAQLRQIQDVVQSAIGYQNERGDSISVQGMNFDTSQMDEAKTAFDEALRHEQIRQYVTAGAILLAALILLFALMRLIRNRRERELEAQLAALPTKPLTEEEPVEEEGNQEARLRDRVRKLAEKEPDAVAFLIRAWLAEE